MIQYLFENNSIIYTFVGLGGLGLLIRFIMNLVYKRLVKESDNMGTTKDKKLKHMKMKFETCYKLKIGVNNVDIFVDKNILRYRFCGVLLSTWESLCGQALYICLLIVPISAVFGVIYECGQDQIILIGGVGILVSAVLIIVDKGINLLAKKRSISLNLQDYLENFLKVRLEQETFHPELLEQYRRDYFQTIEANKQISASKNQVKEGPKDELKRRREARLKKEEERRVQALKREEEQKKIEQARREEEEKRIEERKQLAAKRREEERLKIEEERKALETRRLESKKKVEQKQQGNEVKHQQTKEKDKLLHSLEQDLNTGEEENDMDMLMQGLEEIAAEKEQALQEASEKREKIDTTTSNKEIHAMSAQEEKLIEDVLKEFFA